MCQSKEHRIYAKATWMTEYFAQVQTTGKLFLMKGATWLKMVGISIQDVSQIKKIPARATQNHQLSKKKEHGISVFKNKVR